MTALGLGVEETEIGLLLRYLALLEKWNRVFNLTAVRRLEDMVTLHLLDSLALRPLLPAGPLVDVGSGAGLPGIPIAVTEPTRAIVLVEVSVKKTRFLRQAALELGLNNVTIEQSRVESYHPSRAFATVTSRAFASITDFLRCSGHLCESEGRLFAMKGKYPGTELESLPRGFRLVAVHRLDVPGLAAERHVVEIAREAI